ncbi:MAG TPA: type IV toxin-antitoxin system AbiEi family antitoxin domain-containing protein [Chloroflexota bacterium]|nr:type IV toxin-antitoxin system AbiEi family antitoxin domain-containing protein [Chloroflexota bacterium]
MASNKVPDLPGLEEHALMQGGYFDRTDAHTYGLSDRLLAYHSSTGRFERVFPGVYRLRRAPLAQNDQYLQAWVWSNYRGAISHESALALYDLSDVMPVQVHLTVPPDFRRRSAPFILHWAELPKSDVTIHEGMQVTTPARSIVDAAAAGLGPEQVHTAVRQAIARAITNADELRAAAARSRYRHRQVVQPLIERAVADAAA